MRPMMGDATLLLKGKQALSLRAENWVITCISRRAVVECLTQDSGASPEAMCCVLEQDTLYFSMGSTQIHCYWCFELPIKISWSL